MPPVKQTAVRLGVNVDHVATLRNARGGAHPDPVRAAHEALAAGADSITAHLREDRRHIRDADIERLRNEIAAPLNLEMAATADMMAIALATLPHAACLVPERREEVTTEGGLDAAGSQAMLAPLVDRLCDAGIRVSLFIDPELRQVEAAAALKTPVVEFHTGRYCHAVVSRDEVRAAAELDRLRRAAHAAAGLGIEVHAGHGLDFETTRSVSAIPQVRELNIGHFIVGEAVFAGLAGVIARMRSEIDAGVAMREGDAGL